MLPSLPAFRFRLSVLYRQACLAAALLVGHTAWAQTPGLIVKPASAAGQAVLDPNGDGYVSSAATGFAGDDIAESEIPYKSLAVPGTEPNSDLANGPSCGFTDFVDAPGIAPASTYLSGGNLLFRFRLGGYAPNSKGYSILIDTDGKFGNTGPDADPNYVAGNPGFEVEIELVTNFGVKLFNADGTDNPVQQGATLAYDDYAQKSIAATTICSTPDYFYDFYIPFSVITAAFPGFTAATPVRMVANTVINTLSGLRGPVSDIGGIDDRNYPNPSAAWTAIITGAVPTTLGTIGGGGSFPPQRSAAPGVTGPIAAGATSVSGTSSEANGTVITVFKDGVSIGTATVSGGAWSLAGPLSPALAAGNSITATATAAGKSVSVLSAAVVVGSTCTAPPVINCGSGTMQRRGLGGTKPAGSNITIYTPTGSILSAVAPATLTLASTTFVYNCSGNTTNCNAGGSGGDCLPSGAYRVTATSAGQCESAPVFACVGNPGATATPPNLTNPILPSTTSVSGTSAAANARIDLYAGTAWIGTTTANGSGAWTISGLTFTAGQSITARAVATGLCQSLASGTSTVLAPSAAPVVNGPLSVGATSVSGTSTEAAGTIITVYKNGTSIGTTTVQAGGTWTLTVAALVAGDAIKATATATGKAVSPDSNTVIVPAPATTNIPVITGSYIEGGTSVTGTFPNTTAGTLISVFIDGVLLGTTNTLGGGGWTLSGLSAANFDLYAGGVLTARATETGKGIGPASAGVTVACQAPAVGLTVNLLTTSICESTRAQVEIVNSQAGVIYTLRNAANTANLSPSLLGTGGNITFNSVTLTSTQTIQVQALRIPLTSCNALLTNTASVVVNPNPPTNNTVTYPGSVPAGSSATVQVQNTTSGFVYQLKDNSNNANVGGSVTSASNGSTVSLSTGTVNANVTLYVEVTDATRPTNCTSRLAAGGTIIALPVQFLYVRAFAMPEGNRLEWATASETNNAYFSVERSADGTDFTPIGRVDGAGTRQQLTRYAFSDRAAGPGKAYYRLRQVDLDGAFAYSRVVAVAGGQPAAFEVSPNPCHHQLLVTVRLPAAGRAALELLNSQGRLVRRHEQQADGANTADVLLPLDGLPAGLYTLRIRTAQTVFVERIVKL